MASSDIHCIAVAATLFRSIFLPTNMSRKAASACTTADEHHTWNARQKAAGSDKACSSHPAFGQFRSVRFLHSQLLQCFSYSKLQISRFTDEQRHECRDTPNLAQLDPILGPFSSILAQCLPQTTTHTQPAVSFGRSTTLHSSRVLKWLRQGISGVRITKKLRA